MANYKTNFNQLLQHLDSNETIKFSVFGTYEGKLLGKDALRNGIFAATEKRVIFFSKKTFGYYLESFPFKNISSIEKSKGLMGYAINIFASGNNAKMKWISLGQVEDFVKYINSNIGQSNPQNPNTTLIENDIPSQIKKLADLYQQGILTEQEFSTKKQQLLDKM